MGKSNWKLGITVLVVSVISLTLWFGASSGTPPFNILGESGGTTVNLFLLLIGVVTYVWFWIWAIIAIGNIAQEKGYSKTGFVVFAIFLPIIALIVALVLQPSQAKENATVAAQMVKCPACAELIQPDAQKCKHCGEILVQQE